MGVRNDRQQRLWGSASLCVNGMRRGRRDTISLQALSRAFLRVEDCAL